MTATTNLFETVRYYEVGPKNCDPQDTLVLWFFFFQEASQAEAETAMRKTAGVECVITPREISLSQYELALWKATAMANNGKLPPRLVSQALVNFLTKG